MRLDIKIVDYLFWLKFAWSVWCEIRATTIEMPNMPGLADADDPPSGVP